MATMPSTVLIHIRAKTVRRHRSCILALTLRRCDAVDKLRCTSFGRSFVYLRAPCTGSESVSSTLYDVDAESMFS